MSEHGRRRTYLRGCTCAPCRRANAAYCKQYRNRTHKNGGAIRVDATKARDHLAYLSSHYTTSAIATLAQMNSSAIYRIGSGKQLAITPAVETRILSVRPGRDVGKQWVNPLGAARRVQALCAIGYAVHWQATRLGYQKQSMLWLIRGEKPYITGAVDQRVRALYDELHMTPRVGSDRIERASITKALRMAEREDWAPPLAWNDIDDPDERPATPEQSDRRFTVAALLEDAEWLADADHSLTEVLTRLDVNRNTFRDACRRAGQMDLYWRLANREPDADNRRAVRDGIKQARGVA